MSFTVTLTEALDLGNWDPLRPGDVDDLRSFIDLSSTAEIVTDCAVFQSPGVKVSVAGVTPMSFPKSKLMVTVTFPEGAV